MRQLTRTFDSLLMQPEHIAPAGLLLPLAQDAPSVLVSLALLLVSIIALALLLYHHRKVSLRVLGLQKKLAESDERFQALVQTSNDWIWQVDAGMAVTYCSPQILSILGYTPQEVLGKKPFDFMPTEEAARVRSVVDDAVRRKLPFWKLENKCVTKDGRFIWLESNGTPLLDEHGRLRGYRGVNRDITARRLAENASEEYRRRMESLIGNLFGVAYRCATTPDWPVEFISRGCLELTGYSHDDFINCRVRFDDLVHPDDRQPGWLHINQALAQHQPFNLEYRLIDRTGKTHWVVERGSGIWNQDTLEAFEGLIVDITDHKLAQQQLQQSREFLESVIRSVPTGISVTVDRVYVNVNDRYCEMFGCTRDELIGQSTRMFFPSQEAYDEFGRRMYGRMKQDGTVTDEVTFIKKDGTPIEVLMSGAPIDPADWSKGITFSLLDITERNRISRRLAERLNLERLVADISGGFVNLAVESIDEQVTRSLRLLVERLGMERVRLALIASDTGKIALSHYVSTDLITAVFAESDDLDHDMPEYAALIRQKQFLWWHTARDVPADLTAIHRFFAEKGVRSHLCIPMTVGLDHLGALMITNLQRPLDIDEDLLGYLRVIADTLANALVRKRNLLALADSERRFRTIIESSPMGFLTYQLSPDGDLVFTGTNPAGGKILAADMSALIGKPIEEVFPQLGPKLFETYRRIARDGGSWNGDNFAYQDNRVHGIYDFEAFQTSQGRLAVMFVDVTERRMAEQAREILMRQLRAKNEELESLVYIASHDLRSPLVNIRGFSGELEKCLNDLRRFLKQQSLPDSVKEKLETLFQSDFPECLGFINSGTAKMVTMLDGILRLSRIGTAPSRPLRLNLNAMLEQILRQFKYTLTSAGVSVDIAANLPDCMGDAMLVSQVFSNLIDNAIKYRSPDRPLTIRIEAAPLDIHIEYRVIDNGIGIAPEHIEKVFDIFHQLNPSPNSGQGLGLTIVRKIVEKQDGHVWIDSTPGHGTTVHVALPKV